MTGWDDWGGVICKECGREVFQVQDGFCIPCHRNAEIAQENYQRELARFKDRDKKHGLWVWPKKKKGLPQ